MSISSSAESLRELASMGLRVEANPPLLTFEISEDTDLWPELQFWIAKHRPVDCVHTEFSDSEFQSAEWFLVCPDWHHGYPQPDDGHRYLLATYELSDYCPDCGIGARQVAPFQMKREPKWGRRAILQLNWVFDEYFTTPGVWNDVFKPAGISCRAVVDGNGAELRTVVQLVVEDEVDLVLTGFAHNQCASCRRPKYLPIVRGSLPPCVSPPSAQIAKTTAYFGDGGKAFRGILVEKDLVSIIRSAKLRGVSFEPVGILATVTDCGRT